MINISAFFIGFMVINAIALAAFIGFAAVELTRFFASNRKRRLARRQPFGRYYTQLTLGQAVSVHGSTSSHRSAA